MEAVRADTPLTTIYLYAFRGATRPDRYDGCADPFLDPEIVCKSY